MRSVTAKHEIIKESLKESGSRFEFWINFLNLAESNNMAEVGVYRGDFAQQLLTHCSTIRKYYMIDPWRHLDDWNKPANKDDATFEQFYSEAIEKTEFAADKRIVLRGRTAEVANQIPDGGLDFAYIDGDHTLRGITIDLIRMYPKIKNGGWIGGDDFSRNVWQHGAQYEPTLVFPFAVHFAEAVGALIYALPNAQFLLQKSDIQSFDFVDLTMRYGDVSLRKQLHAAKATN